MLWTDIETNEALALELSIASGVSRVMGSLLAQRGLTTAEAAEAYLRPRLAHLEDPFEIKNLRAAVTRIEKAIQKNESVVVFGDYDVDGITSTVQLVSALRKLGLQPHFCVPLRLNEGYGLSREAIDRTFTEKAPELFIALDCGTNAHEQIAYLRTMECDVIIVDHHQTKSTAPEDCIFINPHVNDSADSPWRDLCTAGLVFKLLHGLLKHLRDLGNPHANDIQLKHYLDLVAMGTIADLVPLNGENRILSWFGLRHLRSSSRSGINALANISKIHTSQQITGSDISFKLAPRINASGRLADATLPIHLLLSEDNTACHQIAEELDTLNRKRQNIQQSIVAEAEQCVEAEFADAPGIVLFNKNWHPGVVGIVASRISRNFHKPCVVLGAEGETAKGSGRSVASVDLVKVFEQCADLLDSWGGHPMAAGIALKADNVAAFTQSYLAALQSLYPEGIVRPSLKLSAWLEITELNETLLNELDRLYPFGQGNSEPVFGLKEVILNKAPRTFGERNFNFNLPTPEGSDLNGIAWRMDDIPEAGRPLDIAVRFSWNYWRNRRSPQITLVDWKYC